MILDHINDIASICAGHQVQTAIISPGSRSAPLTLAFARHPDIETMVVPDERSAAFIALGMAQQQEAPVALICTSGSAAYNYAPAIAEAFFQQVPLLVLTADRPPEWIDQYDGQTIRQSGIYGQHVKASFTYPDNLEHADVQWHANRLVNEALLTAEAEPKGPVHINVPLREPFYPEADHISFYRKARIIQANEPQYGLKDEDWTALVEAWESSKNKLIIGGQQAYDHPLIECVDEFAKATDTPVIADVISNLHGLDNAIIHQDAFLAADLDKENSALKPDLLITFGKSNISKNLKRFIRKHKPLHHCHVQPHDRYQDTFQSLTHLVKMQPLDFFTDLGARLKDIDCGDSYLKAWQDKDQKAHRAMAGFFGNQPFGEFQAVKTVLSHLPEGGLLHLANSMAVRYANFLGLKDQKSTSVWCNRGTSGIDGSNSTAVGAALAEHEMVTLITGDMAFFYDRNAFWHNEVMDNLRIIVLNNHAGGIFRLIKGPSDQPELEEYFETKQTLEASHLAKEYGFEYSKAINAAELEDLLSADFYEVADKPKIIEVVTDSETNAEIFAEFKKVIARYFN